MSPYASLWVFMGLYGSLCVLRGSYGSLWVFMRSSGLGLVLKNLFKYLCKVRISL